MAYWVTFKDRDAGCVDGAMSEMDARRLAHVATGCEPITCDGLPYPASPLIAGHATCPPFCYMPEQCKGLGSCPKNYVCSE